MRIPYTRDALTAIRHGAAAYQLGWPADFYLRVCRERGLQPIRMPEPECAVQVVAAKRVTPEEPETYKGPADARCVFDISRKPVFARAGRAIPLTNRQRDVLCIINRYSKDGARITGVKIAEYTGMDYSYASTVARALQRLLWPLGVVLDSSRERSDPGYRLIDLKSRAPIKIRFGRVKALP